MDCWGEEEGIPTSCPHTGVFSVRGLGKSPVSLASGDCHRAWVSCAAIEHGLCTGARAQCLGESM